jgi:hypothetical protein
MPANRKWVVTSFIKTQAKLKDNLGNKIQTTYVTTCDPHTQYLRGRRNWEVISGSSSTHFIPRISVRVVCVCVGGGGGRGLEKRHHRRLYAPTQTYSIETVKQNKYLQTTVKVQNYIHEGGKRRTESSSA